MKKLLVLISTLVMFLLVVSCAPQEQLTDEELEAELAKLTPEEREELLADLEKEDSGALAGQAFRKSTSWAKKISPRTVQNSKLRIQAAARTVASRGTTADSAQVAPLPCVDSDQQSNPLNPNAATLASYSVKGSVLVTENGKKVDDKTDYCQDTDLIVEYHCNSLNKMVSSTAKCSTQGLVCSDGACKQPADLMVESADFKMVFNATSGQNDVEYTVTVKNAGAGDATGSTAQISGLVLPGMYYVDSKYTNPLPAGSSTTLTGMYSPYSPNDYTNTSCPGSHTLEITLDSNNQVGESDETNNMHTLTVSC